jgi:hypothetical protein
MSRPNDSSRFYHPHNIGRGVHIIKLLILINIERIFSLFGNFAGDKKHKLSDILLNFLLYLPPAFHI